MESERSRAHQPANRSANQAESAYWKEGVLYQLYPPSFKDSDGDGWGDLGGILQKVDYLAELGVSAVWIGPVCDSPMEDNGYDIRDYYKIHEDYGTMEQMEELIAKLHEHDIKLIMDLVINHTSDEHPWFEASRSSTDNPYRDYYIWKAPAEDGGPPNNWRSFSEESAWEFDERTSEYYLHIFDKKQPDLNWNNEDMRRDIYKMITFWLDKGADGFRLDAINMISKDPAFPDAPEDARHPRGQQFYKNGPGIHELLRELHDETFGRYPGTLTLGEAPTVTMDEVVRYTAPERREMDMVLQMELIRLGKDFGNPWKTDPGWSPVTLKESVVRWHKEVFGKGAYALYLNTHDHPRMVGTLFGGREGGEDERKELNDAAAKAIGTFLHTLPGTPLVYQGEELGMPNANYRSPGDYRDKATVATYKRRTTEGEKAEDVLGSLHARSRDGARSPMHWTGGEQAGFTSGSPWIPLNPEGRGANAEDERGDRSSVFHHYRRLIALRKESPVPARGDLTMLPLEDEWVFAYVREAEGERWLVLVNFSDEERQCPVHAEWAHLAETGELLLGSAPAHGGTSGAGAPFRLSGGDYVLHLLPYQSAIYRIGQ
ncbi:alpha-glucosidase [Saccharibacillus sp. CPCC 101409]|uniref:glycoside hydrolase family 13 protein n=1 Tax=Saccharibacillus sp. CPCC 101409 TaxID=3058041 RepID=UPI002672AFBF|nr:alpha-glucosidase [Saccharibacillus sp. CPCC 101409]MDO3409073.1 alpha-glucosidase [Saccharibacillus sp. CPCC 101409]